MNFINDYISPISTQKLVITNLRLTIMQAGQDVENILNRVSTHPYLLNSLTQQYLQTMSSPHNPHTMRWEEVRQILEHLTEEATSYPQCLMLMNALRIVLMETFPVVGGMNKMYMLFFMNYAVRLNGLIREIENKKEEEDWAETMKLIGFGLGMSQIVYEILDFYCKKSPINRTVIPQFYSFVLQALEVIIQKFNNSTGTEKIPEKIRLPNLGISERRPTEDEEREDEKKEKKEKQTTIKITQLLKMISKENKEGSNKNEAVLMIKIVELLQKSFQCSKKKSCKEISIIKEDINPLILAFYLKYFSHSSQKKKTKLDAQKDVQIIQTSIVFKKYLNIGAESKGENEMEEEVDEDPENNIIQVKELTPRFIDEEPAMKIKKLKKKKAKLLKKIESDVRRTTFNRVQQEKVRQDVRHERSHKREKKEMFILQKQTEEAKKFHKQTKKIKLIKKDEKGSKKKGGVGGRKGKR